MPVAIRNSPFERAGRPPLRTPQARLLQAMMPPYDGAPEFDWPTWTRAMLGVHAGYTAVSGTVTRALDGLAARTVRGARPSSGKWVQSTDDPNAWVGNGSGDVHPGLLALGLVEVVVLDSDGTRDVCYRATPAGVAAFREHERAHGKLPLPRDKSSCINDRYKS